MRQTVLIDGIEEAIQRRERHWRIDYDFDVVMERVQAQLEHLRRCHSQGLRRMRESVVSER